MLIPRQRCEEGMLSPPMSSNSQNGDVVTDEPSYGLTREALAGQAWILLHWVFGRAQGFALRRQRPCVRVRANEPPSSFHITEFCEGRNSAVRRQFVDDSWKDLRQLLGELLL